MQNVKVDRDKYIGGSDIPIIMNISPFKTRWELLQEKAGLIENDFNGNQYTEYGNILEPKIRDYINEFQKDKFVEGKDIIGDIRCHTDGINKTTVLEIKTTSQIHDNLDDYKYYLVQLLFYMKYTKRKKGILAIYQRPDDFNELFDSNRLTTYDINIKDYKNLIEEIDLAVDDFRNDLRRIKENPFMTEADLEPVELIEKIHELKEVEEELKGYDKLVEKKDYLKVEIKNCMDNIGKSSIMSDFAKITRVADTKDTEVEVFDIERFKAENEALYEEYLKTEIKKGKSGYLKMTYLKN